MSRLVAVSVALVLTGCVSTPYQSESGVVGPNASLTPTDYPYLFFENWSASPFTFKFSVYALHHGQLVGSHTNQTWTIPGPFQVLCAKPIQEIRVLAYLEDWSEPIVTILPWGACLGHDDPLLVFINDDQTAGVERRT